MVGYCLIRWSKTAMCFSICTCTIARASSSSINKRFILNNLHFGLIIDRYCCTTNENSSKQSESRHVLSLLNESMLLNDSVREWFKDSLIRSAKVSHRHLLIRIGHFYSILFSVFYSFIILLIYLILALLRALVAYYHLIQSHLLYDSGVANMQIFYIRCTKIAHMLLDIAKSCTFTENSSLLCCKIRCIGRLI